MRRATFATLVLTTAAAGLSGYFVGRSNPPAGVELASAEEPTLAKAPALPSAKPATDAPDFSVLKAELRAILKRGYWNLDATWQGRLDALSSAQHQELADFIVAQPPSDARGAIRRAVFASWARRAPLTAVAYAEAINESRVRGDALRAIMHSWAFTDLGALERWARDLPAGKTAQAAVAALLEQVGEIPPATLFAYGLKAGSFTGYNPPLRNLLSAWVQIDPRAAIAALEADLPPTSLPGARNQLVREWALVDPAATVAWIESLPPNESKQLYWGAFETWARTAPADAASRALQLSSVTQRASAIAALVRSWGQSDPDSARNWLLQQPPGALPPRIWNDVFLQLSSEAGAAQTITLLRDMPEAQRSQLNLNFILQIVGGKASPDELEELLNLPFLNTRPQDLQGLLNGIAAVDPLRALALAKSQHLDTTSPQTLHQIIGKIAQTDPELALREVQNLPNSIQRNDALAQIASVLSTNDPELAAVFAEALPAGFPRNQAFSSIAHALLNEIGGAAAVTWINDLPDSSTRAATMDSLAQSWIQTNFAAAIAWYQSTDDAAAKQQALSGFAKHWPRVDPSSFVDAVKSTTDPATLDLLLRFGAGGNLANSSPELALQLLDVLPPGDLQDRTLSSIVTQLSNRAPTEAIGLAQTLPAGPMQETTIAQVMNNWGRQDPTGAVQWLQSQPAATTPSSYYANLAQSWFGEDAAATSTWLKTLPAGPNRDAALSQISQTGWFRQGFAELAPLVPTISDPAERLTTLHQFTRTWLATAPSAASAWINTLDLTPDQKTALLAGQKPSS